MNRPFLLALLFLGLLAGVAGAAPAKVAAAADLRFALAELAEQFRDDTGHAVNLSFGSSGTFAHQIEHGAPFELFLSADEAFVLRLADAGRTVDRGVLYAIGRLVVFAPHGSPFEVDGELRGLGAALADGRIKRFAIANPEHAPYGQRAEEALRHAGLWDAIRPHLVLGENISQAAQFATSGSTQGGIVAQSLALAPAVSALGRFDLIPEDWHRPLLQRMVLLPGAPPSARAFLEYLSAPAAQAVMARYGFAVPRD